MKTIAEYRQEIDQLDDQILQLLNRRASAVIDIGRLKRQDGKVNFHTTDREADIFERLLNNNPGPFPKEAIQSVYREILSASLCLEAPIKVAYLGPRATFTHLAGIRKLGSSAQFIPLNSIKEVFLEVDRGHADFGVVPIENSTEGVVNHTLDMFFESPVSIYGEVLQEIAHHLLTKANDLNAIKKIYSHPHATAQCKNWLESHLPTVPVIDVFSTARAAELAADDPSAAAIASELAASLYGLTILRRRIEDLLHNYTRFLVLSKNAPERTKKSKTSLMISTKDRPGALYDLLRPFASHGINLMKIESRPSRQKAWEYVFFMDLDGHIDDPMITKAIDEIKNRSVGFKVLGSYPADG